MNYLNEYQTRKADFFSQRQFKSSTFPSYDVWIKLVMQGYLGDNTPQMNTPQNVQVLLDNTKQVSKRSGAKLKNFRKNEQKKLSIKERLRKKLLEKKRKEIEEMLKRL